MKACHRFARFTTVLLAGMLAFQVASAATLTLTLRSGTPLPTAPDPNITYLLEPSGLCGAGFPTVFTAADFAAAVAGPNALSIPPFFVWNPSLQCDTLAHWISSPPAQNPRSALYAIHFNVPAPCCIGKAVMSFCWSQDDFLGDLPIGGPNPAGVYINGAPVPAIVGGSYSAESSIAGVDITGLVHCGDNVMYVYDRDAGCAVAGVLFSSTIDITSCITPTPGTTWGKVRRMYR